jgi:flagellar protein FlbT
MPLKLDFKAGDKMIINGAVIENIGNNSSLLIHNEAAILREKEIISEAETATPASRIYFSLQCAYMFPDKKGHYISVFRELLNDYLEAAPSGKEIGSQILVQIDKKRIYNALKLTQKLIGHEIEVFKRMNEDIESEYELQSVKEAD